MSLIGFYWVLLGFIGFYWVLLGFTGFYWVFREGSDQLAELVTRKVGCCGPNELIILASLDFLQCLIIHFFFDSTTNIENDDNQPDYLYSFYSVAFIHIHWRIGNLNPLSVLVGFLSYWLTRNWIEFDGISFERFSILFTEYYRVFFYLVFVLLVRGFRRWFVFSFSLIQFQFLSVGPMKIRFYRVLPSFTTHCSLPSFFFRKSFLVLVGFPIISCDYRLFPSIREGYRVY